MNYIKALILFLGICFATPAMAQPQRVEFWIPVSYETPLEFWTGNARCLFPWVDTDIVYVNIDGVQYELPANTEHFNLHQLHGPLMELRWFGVNASTFPIAFVGDPGSLNVSKAHYVYKAVADELSGNWHGITPQWLASSRGTMYFTNLGEPMRLVIESDCIQPYDFNGDCETNVVDIDEFIFQHGQLSRRTGFHHIANEVAGYIGQWADHATDGSQPWLHSLVLFTYTNQLNNDDCNGCWRYWVNAGHETTLFIDGIKVNGDISVVAEPGMIIPFEPPTVRIDTINWSATLTALEHAETGIANTLYVTDLNGLEWLANADIKLWSVGYPTVLVATVPFATSDFNCDGECNSLDIFAFLTAWFDQDVSADMDDSGDLSVLDIFMYLTMWFESN